ncbi:MAG: hypothetical protein U0X91_07815 [Spirosomataceae bacterium]
MTHLYPKHLIALFFVTLSAYFLVSCGKKGEQTAEQQAPSADTVLNKTEPVVSTDQSELLRLVISPQGGDFRGFKFGDPIRKIKAEEKFELFEDSTGHVGYTYETENFEAIDILYYLDNNQALNGVRVDIYLNDAKAVKNLSEQFETYLSGKYTPDKKQGKTTAWRDNRGYSVALEDVSKGKDFGLRLGIGPKGSKALSM